ncbi:MAG TPA: hypothetical protein VNQ90_05860 [Chthoniobacteraceae bacterium]|nr:hypothetical protein [Chthoniobacteraceae bacterium]
MNAPVQRLRYRPDLLDAASPEGLEIWQITANPALPACHISMEAQVFSPDSRFFILHEGIGVQSCDHRHPDHRLLLCDAETGGLTPVSDERGVTAFSVSPDGRFLYYFVDESEPGAGRLLLRRRNLDGSAPETVSVLDAAIPGTPFRASRPNPLSTISTDGRRLAVGCFLGDGNHHGGPYGLLVFELETGEARLILHGPAWRNIHAQYSRSEDPVERHDLLVQENHGGLNLPDGSLQRRPPGRGADLHVVRDDGQHWRNIPWGRVEGEWVVGHQCWRGRSGVVIGSIVAGTWEQLREMRSELRVVESRPAPHWGHEGAATAGGGRNRVCREFAQPHFNHIASSLSGTRLVADYRPCWNPEVADRDAIYLFDLGEPETGAARKIRPLFSPRSSWKPSAHVHPFFSPDGRTLLFNSDESGQTQAYLVRNLPPEA